MRKGSDFERLKAQCGTWAREDYYVNPNQGHNFRVKAKAEKKGAGLRFAAITAVLCAVAFAAVFKGEWVVHEVQVAMSHTAPMVAAIIEK